MNTGNNTHNNSKHSVLAFIGIISLLCLLLLSVIFFQERTIFTDIAYHLFFILKDKHFTIPNNRWGAFFTQLFPLIASQLGCSLRTVAVLYSTSFVVLPLLTFLTLIFFFKNKRLSTAYLLFLFLFNTHTFYWIQSELPQGAAFMFLFFACFERLLFSKKISISLCVAATIFLLLSVFSHPLLLFGVVFILLFYFIEYKDKRRPIIGVAFLYILAFLLKSILLHNSYDDQAMSGINNFSKLFPNYFFIHSNKQFLRYCFHDYYLLPLAALTMLLYYFKQENYSKLFVLLLSLSGYLLLINVSYPNGAEQYYIENQYLILGIFLGISLAFDGAIAVKAHKQSFILTCICFLGIFRFINAHTLYSARLDWERKFLSKTACLKEKKIVVPENDEVKKNLLLTWGSAYEFWLLSTIDSGTSRSVIMEENPGEFDWALQNNKTFLTKWGTFDYATLDPAYFRFSDTSKYVKFEMR